MNDELTIYNDFELVQDLYMRIFRNEPANSEQAKQIVSNLIENLCLKTNQDDYSHINLDGILNHVMHYTEFVKFDFDYC